MTIILENTDQVEFHTDLSKLVKPFKDKFRSLNWLLTDLDFIILDAEEYGEVYKLDNEKPAIIYTGDELSNIIENRKIQFVWGVLTGIKGEIPEIPEDKLPFSDLNRDLWKEPERFQIPSAEIEIVCWDSSSTLIKFKDEKLGKKFLQKFTDGMELKNKC